MIIQKKALKFLIKEDDDIADHWNFLMNQIPTSRDQRSQGVFFIVRLISRISIPQVTRMRDILNCLVGFALKLQSLHIAKVMGT